MRKYLLKALLGVAVSLLVVSVTNVARADDPTSGNYFHLAPFSNEADCVSVGGTVPNDGAKVIGWPCKSATAAQDQAWFWDASNCFTTTNESTGEQWQWCTIRNSQESQTRAPKCLGISGGSRNEGAQAVTWDCLGKTHYDQYWRFELLDNGGYWLWNYNMFTDGLGVVGYSNIAGHESELFGLTPVLA